MFKIIKDDFISAKLNGRLGNNLFQIASIWFLAKQNKAKYCFDDDWYYKFCFIRKEEMKNKHYKFSKEWKEEKWWVFKGCPSYIPNTLYRGYFQSPANFDQDFVYKIFDFDKKIKEKIKEKYKFILNYPNCSIHIRRGDYTSNYIDSFQPSEMKYYKNAINFLYSRYNIENFIIFSDDILWCKENFKNFDKINFIFIENEKDYIDLILMSMCDNNIIANSTFSWWGAYLNRNNNKVIISPSIWLDNKKSSRDVCQRVFKDMNIIPESWITF